MILTHAIAAVRRSKHLTDEEKNELVARMVWRANYYPWKPKKVDPPPSITCPKCNMTSHNPNDVREKYCSNCHMFHEGVDNEQGRVSGGLSGMSAGDRRSEDDADIATGSPGDDPSKRGL